ncbi:hypothetical protein FSP39_004580 [Pinctada imbricata]|uniref:Uncharacterized protein n=1 Tax=Pinctada imbricata TaxID=66713 RepID=A0AA88YDR8_PINIB|nr:hypothetical protein FSP39_004580 [Pinctada imbricata]
MERLRRYYFLIIFCGIAPFFPISTGNIVGSSFKNLRPVQVIKPVIYHNNTERETTHHKDGHLDDITLYFNAFDQQFVADLNINKNLFASSYIVKSLGVSPDKASIKRPNIKPSHCYYHGHVRGDVHSMVAVSTCDGIRGLVSYKDRTYHIEPAGDIGDRVHRLYLEKDDRPGLKHNCGHNDKHSRFYSNATVNYLHTREVFGRMRRSAEDKKKKVIRGPFDSNDNTRYVEMYLVNDYRTYTNYQGNERLIIQRSQDIVNIVSRLYNPLNIHVALVGVETWKSRDMFTISDQANVTLESFLHYRRNHINPNHQNDNAQLITSVQFTGSTLGRAQIASICSFQYSAGVNMNIRDRLVQVATTVAHELGHNFGMEHDNYSYCQCAADKCIMAPTGGGISTPTQWSSCSRNSLMENFDIGMDYCLKNKPAEIFDGPVCGNGFMEEGEQCDCGTKECKTKCCNASTCRLSPGSSCATGQCCDLNTCKPKQAATLCRGAFEFCDLPEFCNGESEWCPSDVYRQNGQKCMNGQASYCYNGTCKTHTAQCKLLWGSTGRVSDPICFQHLNINGSKHGNCGYNWETRTYNRCDKEDVLCGLLHCVHLNEKLMFWRESLAEGTPATFLTKGSKQYVCRSAILDVGLDMPDPGQAPDGAKCAEKKICVNHKCQSLSKLKIKSCPDCNDHGVCNSIGQCHCSEGFAPPNCNEPGHGGSRHSGPVKIKDSNSTMIGLLVTFTILVLAGVLAFIAYYNREYIKKWWRNRPGDFKHRLPCLSLQSEKPPPRSPPNKRAPPKPPAASYKPKNKSVDISTPVLQTSTNKQSGSPSKSLFSKFTSKGASSYTEENTIPPPTMTLISKPQPAPPPKVEFKPSPKPAPKPVPKLPAKPQNSNTSAIVHDPIVKKDSFNREISKPVLISTTDRRSMAFARENSFENGRSTNDESQVAPPPIPPHTAKKRESSTAPLRPTSMPPQPQKLKFADDEESKRESRKSMAGSGLKSPPRPPPPNVNFTDISTAKSKAGEPSSRKIIDKAKYRIEAESAEDKLPRVKNRSPAVDKRKKTDSDSKSLKPLLSTNNDKTSIAKNSRKPDSTSSRGKPSISKQSSFPSQSIPPKPSVTKQMSNPSRAAKPLTSQASDASTQESPAVAHIKAMFDSMDIGSKPIGGPSTVTRTNSGGNGDRPRPPPKPGAGSKFRSVNV